MAKKHTHKYFYGHKVGSTTVWRCALPKCSHYLPEHMEDHIIGRMGICWSCNEEMELDGDKKRPKPLCEGCLAVDQYREQKLSQKIQEVTSPIETPSYESLPMCKVCKKSSVMNPRADKCHACFMATV